MTSLSDYKMSTNDKRKLFAIMKQGWEKGTHFDTQFILTNNPELRAEIVANAQFHYPDLIDGFIAEILLHQRRGRLGAMFNKGLSDLVGDVLIDDIIKDVLDVIEDIQVTTQPLYTTMEEAFEDKNSHVKIKIDNQLSIQDRSIYLITGRDGTWKTKFTIYTAARIMQRYNDKVAILWANLEDPNSKIIQGLISTQTLEEYDDLSAMKLKDHYMYDEIKKYNINFIGNITDIVKIGKEFKAFRTANKDKFCLLIVDNMMSLDQLKAEGEVQGGQTVMLEVDNWKIKTIGENACVFMLHHIKKADDKDVGVAYRPHKGMIRGTSRTLDVPTQILMLNNTWAYPNIYERFTHHNQVKRMLTVEYGKNRNGPLSMLRYVGYPEYNVFKSFKTKKEK